MQGVYCDIAAFDEQCELEYNQPESYEWRISCFQNCEDDEICFLHRKLAKTFGHRLQTGTLSYVPTKFYIHTTRNHLDTLRIILL